MDKRRTSSHCKLAQHRSCPKGGCDCSCHFLKKVDTKLTR